MKKIYYLTKTIFLFLIIVLVVSGISPKQANADIVGVNPFEPLITVYADNTWAVISQDTLILPGFTVTGSNAVTWNSDNLMFYAIVKVDAGPRRLVTVDPYTGVCTDIGSMGANFSTLTYSSTTGTMYAMGGTGSSTFAMELVSIDLNTGTPTYLGGPFTLIADDGQVIAYNYTDGFIYHWSGFPASNAKMGKIDLNTMTEAEVVQSGDAHSEVYGAVYTGNGNFVVTDIDQITYTISSTGVVDSVSMSEDYARGLGYVDPLLPVELASFTSSVNGRDVELNWTTSSETNNLGFEIERSNGGVYTKIGNVSGNGTSTASHSYTFADRSLNSGVYSYRLKQIDFNGNYEYHNLSNEVNIGVPNEFSLSQNYPNPFNPTTNIEFGISETENVSLKVYNASGKEVATLINEVKPAGYYSVSFNGSSSASGLSSGIYFYTLTAGNFVSTKKMTLIK